MPREYIPSTGHHKRGRKPGSGKKEPKKAEGCLCGKDAIRMGGDECAKCGRRLPDYA